MKFLEDTNAWRVRKDDPLIVMMTREEAKLIGEVLRAHVDANKRARKAKAIADKWDELAPVFT